MKHGSDSFSKSAIESFCNTIPLRPVAHSVASGNPMFFTEGLKLLGHVLAALVIVQSPDFPTQLVLSKRFELLECGERVAFPPEQYHNSVACIPPV